MGCVFPAVVSILPRVEVERYDHQEDAPHFNWKFSPKFFFFVYQNVIGREKNFRILQLLKLSFLIFFLLKSLESANVPEPTVTQIPIISPKLPLDTICGDLEGPEFKRLKSILGRDPCTFIIRPSAQTFGY